MDLHCLKKRFTGETAKDYEGVRRETKMWENEGDAVEEYLKRISSGESEFSILDLPVGTGRFLPLYNRLPVQVMGVDNSEDMLREARKKLKNENINHEIQLKKGDVMDPNTYGIEPDVVVCIRFLDWLEEKQQKEALLNLFNSKPKHLIVELRVYSWYVSYMLQLARLMKSFITNFYDSRASARVHFEKPFKQVVKKNGFSIHDKKIIESKYGTKKNVYWLTRKTSRK